MGLKSKLSLLLAVGALSMVSAVAQADSVTFHTVVTFTSGGTGGTVSGGGTVLTASGGDTLTISDISPPGRTEEIDNILPSGTFFGTFQVNTPDNSVNESFTGAGIEVDVYQDATNPSDPNSVAGPGTFVGSARGTLKPVDSTSTLLLDFQQPLTFTLPSGAVSFPPGVIYTVDGPTQTIQFDNTGLGAIRGNVMEASTPLPNVASLGLVMCGGLGVFSMLRRRAASIA